jgi:hypothetical protein
MAGSAGTTTWTHFRATTNGVLMLCDSTGTLTSSPAGNSYGSIAALSATSLYGPANSNPRLAPFWGDLDSSGAGNGVFFDNASNPGVSCKVTWKNVREWNTVPLKSFSAEIFANGNVVFSYGAGTNVVGGTKFVGVSCANAVGVPAASNLSPGPASSATGAMHQTFGASAFDIASQTITFVPNGAGWNESVTCQVLPATHTSYGSGCYNISDSLYQLFADAAVASAGMTGQSVTFTPSGASYTLSWGGGVYVAPTIAAVNVFATATDDGESVVTPTAPFFTPTGPEASVRVHSNGVISWGAAAQTFPGTSSWIPTAAGFLAGGNAGIYSWHDYNESEVGSGRIKSEEVGGVLYVTWDNVENYSVPAVVNPSTMQFQLTLATGQVTIVWPSIDAAVTSVDGTQHLIGYSPAGASINGGSVNLATALPVTTSALNVAAMALAAAPAPVSTAGSGTLVTYTQSNIPEAVPASGIYLGATILSVGQDLPGSDLTILGMPGCSAHITSLDVLVAFVGGTNSLTTQFQVPAGVPYGFQLFAQSVALVAPGSLPNGQNTFGATLSNGVASFVSIF